jgi:hypothetical protein
MSVTEIQSPVFVAGFRQTNEDDEIAEALAEAGRVAIDDELIARVLRRAHRLAESLDAPDEARVILHIAHSFADELAVADPRFDRVRFIDTVMDMPS